MKEIFHLQLTGAQSTDTSLGSELAEKQFDIQDAFLLDAQNRSTGTVHTRDLFSEIIRLETEDEVEWYGYGDDLPELTGEPVETDRRGGGEKIRYTLPGALRSTTGGTRGGGFGMKLLQIILPKSGKVLGKVTAETLGRMVDDKVCPNPGLHRVNRNGDLVPLTADTPIDTTRPALIFIHGTISSFEGGFSGIANAQGAWESLHEQYNGNIFAFNHRTITDSPVGNALDLLKVLPKGLTVDLITHSRGGLIGDVLARCDTRINGQLGYTQEEIARIRLDHEEEDPTPEVIDTLTEEMEAIGRIASGCTFTLRRMVRVACPAAGTTLLSDRLEHFINAVINVVKVSTGAAAVPLLGVLRAFVMQVIAERKRPSTFPGLYAMVPEMGFVAINNTSTLQLPSVLVNIAGDSEVGRPNLRSLAVMLSNLYYWQANDFVVDTASMSKGIRQRKGNFTLLFENTAVDHFSYFSVSKHWAQVRRVLLADSVSLGVLPEGDQHYTIVDELREEANRGTAIDTLFGRGELQTTAVFGKRPIVVLIPGVMGSNLYSGNELQWLKFSAIIDGCVVEKLHAKAVNVSARSIIAKDYGKLSQHLTGEGYDVSIFPYDWRLSLNAAGNELHAHLTELEKHEQPISIIAHSMGGIVARQFMFQHTPHWHRLRNNFASRLILLGTPWRGSHLITELITGHSSRVRQLHISDLKYSRKKIIETVGRFPGPIELLPIDDDRLENRDEWQRMIAASKSNTPEFEAEMRDHFLTFKKQVSENLGERGDKEKAKLKEADFDSISYVAGYYKTTVDDYEYVYKQWRKKEILRYIPSPFGDGRVTWEKGIPKELPKRNVYYTDVQHGNLAAEPRLFEGLVELLRDGATKHAAFAKTPQGLGVQVSRGGTSVSLPHPVFAQPSGLLLSPSENLLGLLPEDRNDKDQTPVIRLTVFNGDLKWARYPVVVGHFKHDGIVSAERTIDTYLGGVLSERHMLGFYPGDIGEQEVIIDRNRHPNGTVVVGLGDKDDLNGYGLAKTIEKGLLKYALFNRDNHLDQTDQDGLGFGISMLLIGSNYGQLPLRECLRNLVLGIQQANAVIAARNSSVSARQLQPIREVELVDYYEDRAYEAFQLLEELNASGEFSGVQLGSDIEHGFGSRKRFLREGSRSWWQTVTTTTEVTPFERTKPIELAPGEALPTTEKLRFDTYNRSSSVSLDNVNSNLKLARYLAKEMSVEGAFNPTKSKVLFELLIPNRYKDFIRNYRNIVWRMDLKSAEFPWELFYDASTGREPAFVRAGMVRQLQSRTANIRPALVRQSTALVIGNPDLGTNPDELSDLPGARAEAFSVANALSADGYTVTRLIDERGLPILSNLVGKPYKIMHIAAHGRFSEGAKSSGIMIADGEVITPGDFRQLSSVPELVFVNCCYLGVIDEGQEEFRRNRHRLAANIGTQLIELGVKAVVVAGWAVDDGAAKTFANTFYDQVLAGNYFGEAVRLARKKCFDLHPQTNTWGAYQCYGDQFYRTTLRSTYKDQEEDLSLVQEIQLELDNLISRARNVPHADMHTFGDLRKRASTVLLRANELGVSSPKLIAQEAQFHSFMGDYPAAIDRYEALFNDDAGQYRYSDKYDYLNLKVRLTAANVLCRKVSPKVMGDAHTEIIGIHEKLLEFSKQQNQLGATVQTHFGSICKRLAATSSGKVDARKFLSAAANGYCTAAAFRGFMEVESIYQVCSLITLYTLATPDNTKVEAVITKAIQSTPEEYFKRWADESAYLNGERNSPYALLRGANLRLSEYIWKLSTGKLQDKDVPDKAEELIELHRKQQAYGFNLRDLNGQVEHYDILLRLLDILDLGTKVQRAQLRRIRTWLAGRVPTGGGSSNGNVPEVQYKQKVPVLAVEHDGRLSAKPNVCDTCQLDEKTEGDLLITSVSVDLRMKKGQRSSDRPTQIRISIPDDATAILTRFEGDDGEEYYAWIPNEASASSGVRGVSVKDNFLILEIGGDATRGFGKKLKALLRNAKNAVVQFYRSAKGFVGKELMNRYELQVLQLDSTGAIQYEKVSGKQAFKKATQDADRSLLMLHGMFNTAKGTFKDLLDHNKTGKVEPSFAKLLNDTYGGRAIAMNMPTIFRSFKHNAAKEQFPLQSVRARQLDVMANSRGTNVARELVLKLGKQGVPQRGRVFLAGGPAFGTPFANKTHMLSLVNKITTLFKLAGKPLGPVVPILVWLLEKGASAVLSGDGLVDMEPGSDTLKDLNSRWGSFDQSDTLFVGSNYEPTGVSAKALARLIDAQLIDNAIMQGVDNDGIIPTQGTLGLKGTRPYTQGDPHRYRVPKANACGHFMYYDQKQVIDRLIAHLGVALEDS